MMRRLLCWILVAASAAGALTSCGSPDRGAPTSASQTVLGPVGKKLAVLPVTRSTPLTSDVTWTFSAGPAGAVSSNSAVGLTIVIPAGALASTRRITVTALAGAPVAYAFSPHLQFALPVTMTQSLVGTSAASNLALPLVGAHFNGNSLSLTSSGFALVEELTPAVVNPLAQTATWSVGHFSGWIIASDDGSAQ